MPTGFAVAVTHFVARSNKIDDSTATPPNLLL
jgi:hypothetical protein